jgi:hypothetical protein
METRHFPETNRYAMRDFEVRRPTPYEWKQLVTLMTGVYGEEVLGALEGAVAAVFPNSYSGRDAMAVLYDLAPFQVETFHWDKDGRLVRDHIHEG